jgi:predicted glycosyl hydrolase (DUF1957 family)
MPNLLDIKEAAAEEKPNNVAETEKVAEDEQLQEIYNMYLEKAAELLKENSQEVTDENIEKVAEALIQQEEELLKEAEEAKIQEDIEKVAEAEQLGIIMARSFKSELDKLAEASE